MNASCTDGKAAAAAGMQSPEPENAVHRAPGGAGPATVLMCTAAALPCGLTGLLILLAATRRAESRRSDAVGGRA
jgi:hypothetical protein